MPTMKAVVNTHYGSPDVLEIREVPKPEPGPGEVLVRVYATTVSRTDCGALRAHPFFMRLITGFLRPKRTILGMDFSGQVEAVGAQVTSFRPGDRVFGPERTGLANRDLDRCTHQVLIPTNEHFSSLNLASAVQLLCYEIFLASREASGSEVIPAERRPTHNRAMEAFYAHLEEVLDARGFLDGDMREVTMTKFRRLVGRARPNPGELKLLHTLLRMIHPGSG